MKPCFVYYLLDPESQAVRYVGITYDPVRRYSTHCKGVGTKRHSECWIQSLRARGVTPTMKLVALVQDQEEAKRIEIALIAKHNDLTNISTGGEGGSGVWFSTERRAAQAERMRARYQNPEERLKHSERMKQFWNSHPEARARVSEISRSRTMPLEAREKIRSTLMGHEVTEESRIKMSVSHQGRKHSAETKAKMSASRMGHAVSAEARAKASATHKAMWNKRRNCVGE